MLVRLVLNTAVAQTTGVKISGQVNDQDKKPVEGASVILAKDSTIITTLLTGPDGTFVFTGVKDNHYKITISFIGYKNYSQQLTISNQRSVNLPVISLVPTGNVLKEVAVTAQKSFTEQKIDRTVVNVNALISNAGANALAAPAPIVLAGE